MQRHNELYHYGILGQKWGVRRFQNKDGTLTEAGRIRYFPDETELNARYIEYGRQKKNIENTRKIVEKTGPIGKLMWYTGPYAIRDRFLYERAKRRINNTLAEMNSRYVVVYDPQADEYIIKDKIQGD